MSLALLVPVLGPILDRALSMIPDPNERERAKLQAEKAIIAAAAQAGSSRMCMGPTT